MWEFFSKSVFMIIVYDFWMPITFPIPHMRMSVSISPIKISGSLLFIGYLFLDRKTKKKTKSTTLSSKKKCLSYHKSLSQCTMLRSSFISLFNSFSVVSHAACFLESHLCCSTHPRACFTTYSRTCLATHLPVRFDTHLLVDRAGPRV